MTDASPHLDLADVAPRVQYFADGQETHFVFPFPIFAESDVTVLVDQGPIGSGFRVDGVGASQGGAVVFDTPPETGRVVTLLRRLAIERRTDFLQGGAMRADTFNDAFDRQVAIAQQLADDLSRGLRAPAFDRPANLELPDLATRAGKALVFDDQGNVALGALEAVQTETALFDPSIPGVVVRGQREKLADLLSVEDFGAVGDGFTDDTAAFTAALAAVDTVLVPNGTFILTSTLTLSAEQRLIGLGPRSEIRQTAAGQACVELIGPHAAILGVTLSGGSVGLWLHGGTDDCRFARVEDVVIRGADTGVLIDGSVDAGRTCDYNTLDRVVVIGPTLHGVHLTRSAGGAAPRGNRFTDVQVHSDGTALTGSGFFVEHGHARNLFRDCQAVLAGAGLHSAFRIGAGSLRTVVDGLFTTAETTVPNLQIDLGADETVVSNLQANGPGPNLSDFSGAVVQTVNAGWPTRTRLQATHVTDLAVDTLSATALTEEVRFTDTVGTWPVDLTAPIHLVSAFSGAVSAVLPAAGAARGRRVTLKKNDPSAHAIAVTDADGVGPDNGTVTLDQRYRFVTVVSDGAAWHVVGRG